MRHEADAGDEATASAGVATPVTLRASRHAGATKIDEASARAPTNDGNVLERDATLTDREA